MCSRHLSGFLLRPTSLQTFSVTSIPSAAWQRATPYLSLSQRTFASSIPRSAAQPHSKPEEAPSTSNPEDSQSNATSSQSSQPQPQSQSQDGPIFFSSREQSQNDTTAQALDDMFANYNRISRSGSGSGSNPTTAQPKTTSADEFGAAFNQSRSRSPFGAGFSRPPSSPRSLSPKNLDFAKMAMPTPSSNASPFPAPQVVPEEEKKYPRLNASTGRVVELDNAKGRDIVRGLGMLASLMARNRVKSDVFKQRFHERPGLKRKRLKSERWRARFKIGFDRTCKRVSELTRQGW